MNIKHILFPTDFSDHSRAMNSEVEWLAEHFQARVTLLHVFDMPTYWYGGFEAPLFVSEDFVELNARAKQRLQEYKVAVPESRLERILVEGSPAFEIASWAAEHKVDLVIMGTHGFGQFRRLLLGSVAMKLLHDLDIPVWTHPSEVENKLDSKRGISRIVCSVELTQETVPLLRFVKNVADSFGAAVFLVHCVPETQSRPAKYFDEDFHRSIREMARKEVQELQREAGTSFPLQMRDRLIAEDVAEAAATMNADLIIIGRGKAQSAFGSLRTHAYDIICQAPCPVLSFCTAQDEDALQSEKSEAPVMQSVVA